MSYGIRVQPNHGLGLCLLPLLALLLSTAAGCGGSGDFAQIDLSGQVSFNGQPVTNAIIYFEPDVKAGHNGPQGFAPIVDGRYNTQHDGRGVTPGPHLVRIEEQPPIEGQASRPMLFRSYTTQADLTSETTEQNFEVPADAGKKKGRR